MVRLGFLIYVSSIIFSQANEDNVSKPVQSLLWKSAKTSLVQMSVDVGDYHSQEIIFKKFNKSRSLLTFEHRNYDGNSMLKVNKDGSFIFAVDETGYLKINGKNYDFSKICREIECPGKKVCDGSYKEPPPKPGQYANLAEKTFYENDLKKLKNQGPPAYIGVQIRFDSKTETLSTPEGICYKFIVGGP